MLRAHGPSAETSRPGCTGACFFLPKMAEVSVCTGNSGCGL